MFGGAKPTSPVVQAKFNELRQDLALLFDLKRLQAEALYEIQVLKEQKGFLTGLEPSFTSMDLFKPNKREVYNAVQDDIGRNEELVSVDPPEEEEEEIDEDFADENDDDDDDDDNAGSQDEDGDGDYQ
eukprot:TRINITY_DN3717_c0_g2_i2.p2 TRINITY_DN3717_c0_g2~~TRINITY_DN3717_c0_g2_i2.p2  ORF type:complete len:128 (-),score=43.87 TRINITY_DN3717_c0_g2_i2:171-554(-)